MFTRVNQAPPLSVWKNCTAGWERTHLSLNIPFLDTQDEWSYDKQTQTQFSSKSHNCFDCCHSWKHVNVVWMYSHIPDTDTGGRCASTSTLKVWYAAVSSSLLWLLCLQASHHWTHQQDICIQWSYSFRRLIITTWVNTEYTCVCVCCMLSVNSTNSLPHFNSIGNNESHHQPFPNKSTVWAVIWKLWHVEVKQLNTSLALVTCSRL